MRELRDPPDRRTDFHEKLRWSHLLSNYAEDGVNGERGLYYISLSPLTSSSVEIFQSVSVSVDWLEELKMEVEVEWRFKITTDTANTIARCFRWWRLTVKVKGLVC